MRRDEEFQYESRKPMRFHLAVIVAALAAGFLYLVIGDDGLFRPASPTRVFVPVEESAK